MPLPLPGPYDYRLPDGEALPRGTLVVAPLGPRETLGVVWGESEGAVSEKRLKEAVPLEGDPRLPPHLVRFHRLGGALHAQRRRAWCWRSRLRARAAFEPEVPRIGYVRGGSTPPRMTPGRARVLEVVRDGLARSVPAIAEEANVDARRSARLDRGRRAGAARASGIRTAAAAPIPSTITSRSSADQKAAADALTRDVAAHAILHHACSTASPDRARPKPISKPWPKRCWQDKQTLILLPEIALTVQFLERFAAALRLPAGRMAFRSLAEGTQARLSRGDERARRASW